MARVEALPLKEEACTLFVYKMSAGYVTQGSQPYPQGHSTAVSSCLNHIRRDTALLYPRIAIELACPGNLIILKKLLL
ncbi:MAG: hypothetical protein EAZ59_28405 [Oscillatoriales cyanobacterium]|nr:MAG: hypothetical protein EAZ59_28405 [Oscillatoriales cyanobacterium]